MKSNPKIPNAQKWTEERVMINLMAIETMAHEPDIMYLGRALIRQGLYAEIWAYWKRHFADNEDIIETMLRIDTIFEAKLFEGALCKKLSPWVAIFGLKNNYQWDTKPQPDEQSAPQRMPMLIELDEHTVMQVP